MNINEGAPAKHGRAVVGRILRWWALLTAVALMLMIPAAAADTEADFADPSFLVSTERLQRLLAEPNVQIIDVRSAQEFQKGHIPNAVSLPARHVVDPASRIKGTRRSDNHLARIFGKLGIGKGTHVVFYDARGGHLAARLFWIVHYMGHQRASVLDGGFPKWLEEGRPVSEEPKRPNRGMFPIDRMPRRLATAGWILDHMHDPDFLIIDVRKPEMYAKSHIPGAINIPWKKNLNADETWKRPEELRQLYESSGVAKDKNIVVYCQFGNMNAHTYITLKALGYSRVRSYDRAWAEWGSDPSLPKAGRE